MPSLERLMKEIKLKFIIKGTPYYADQINQEVKSNLGLHGYPESRIKLQSELPSPVI